MVTRMGYGGVAAETGMLSSEEFKDGALHFVEVWQQYSSGHGTWWWHPASNSLVRPQSSFMPAFPVCVFHLASLACITIAN